jgi:hypothetical protein
MMSRKVDRRTYDSLSSKFPLFLFSSQHLNREGNSARVTLYIAPPKMPGCFSRLSNKFRPKNGRNPVDSSDDSTGPPAGNKPLAISEVGVKPSDDSNPPPSKKPETSEEGPGHESGEKQSLAPRDRWLDAFNQLPPAKQSTLKGMGFGASKSENQSSIKDLVKEVNEKQKECEKKFWHVNLFGEKIVLREYTTKIIGWLEKAGDVAVQFAPPQVSLPWDCVKSLMKVRSLVITSRVSNRLD